MALFKILRGAPEDLGKDTANKTTIIHDGYAYFTPEDGKFYIDVDPDPKNPNLDRTPIVGGGTKEGNVNRICINDYFVLDCGGAFDE